MDPAEKLAKLIPRLASTHDGEVVATVRAIERALKSAGKDWHDLAKAIGSTAGVSSHRATPRPEAASSYYTMAQSLLARRARLNSKELRFVEQMVERTRMGLSLNWKQTEWLADLYESV